MRVASPFLAMFLQLIRNEQEVIDKCQLPRIEISLLGNDRKFSPETSVIFPDFPAAGNSSFARSGLKPVTHMANRFHRTALVSLNILAANVRDETSVAIRFAIQNQDASLRAMFAKTFCAKKNSQFQRHVEPR
jgi:hypothetical protein